MSTVTMSKWPCPSDHVQGENVHEHCLEIVLLQPLWNICPGHRSVIEDSEFLRARSFGSYLLLLNNRLPFSLFLLPFSSLFFLFSLSLLLPFFSFSFLYLFTLQKMCRTKIEVKRSNRVFLIGFRNVLEHVLSPCFSPLSRSLSRLLTALNFFFLLKGKLNHHKEKLFLSIFLYLSLSFSLSFTLFLSLSPSHSLSFILFLPLIHSLSFPFSLSSSFSCQSTVNPFDSITSYMLSVRRSPSLFLPFFLSFAFFLPSFFSLSFSLSFLTFFSLFSVLHFFSIIVAQFFPRNTTCCFYKFDPCV